MEDFEQDEALCTHKILCYEYSKDWETIELYSLSDLHIGDPLCDVKAFRSFVKFIAEQENRLVILNGDMMNNATKSSVSNVYNETCSPNEQRKWLVKELMPIKKQILCSVEGNHERRSKKDVDLSQSEWVANMLDVPYYENFCCLKIMFGRQKLNNKKAAYTVLAVHGSGGGSLLGGILNKGEKFFSRVEGCDLLVLGHVHKKVAGKIGSLIVDPYNNQIREVEKAIMVSSHWSAYGGYASRMMLAPSAKGCCYAVLNGRRKGMKIVV